MNKTGLWFFLSLKRQVKRIFFLVLLLFLPAGLWCFRAAGEGESEQVKVALYAGESAWNRKVAKELLSDTGSFGFYVSSSEEALREDVKAGRAECGYIFPEDLKERLETGDYKRCIVLVSSPSTTAGRLSTEIVFSGLFTVWGRELLEAYAGEGEAFCGQKDVWEQLEPLYDRYLNNGSTFAFQYVTSGGSALEEPTLKTSPPARGIAAVFIFVMGLAAAVTVCEDIKKGLFGTMSGLRREAAIMACLAAPVSLACLSGFAGLGAAGVLMNPAGEAGLLLLYGCSCTVFSWVLCRLVRNPLAIACLIPFFIIGSLVFCPVFVDLSLFLPALKTAGKLFLPWYYLKAAAFL